MVAFGGCGALEATSASTKSAQAVREVTPNDQSPHSEGPKGRTRLDCSALLGCSGDLVSRLSNGPYGASYGLIRGLIGDTKWTY